MDEDLLKVCESHLKSKYKEQLSCRLSMTQSNFCVSTIIPHIIIIVVIPLYIIASIRMMQ